MAVRTGTQARASSGRSGPTTPTRPPLVARPSGGSDRIERRDHASGIVVLWCADDAIEALAIELGEIAPTRSAPTVLLHYSARVDADALAAALTTHAGSLAHFGCSTGGELTPGGVQTDSILAVLLPRDVCRIDLGVIEHIDRLGIQAIAHEASRQRLRFLGNRAPVVDPGPADEAALADTGPTDPIHAGIDAGADRTTIGALSGSLGGGNAAADASANPLAERRFAICLIDGLTFQEEAVTAALDRGLEDIPLIGGSAGGDLARAFTTQLCNGRVYRRAAVLALVECDLPFRIFSANHLRPTATRFVVTASDIERRRVIEFDAEPAADAYARAIGVAPDALDARVFAAHPVVVRIGGDCYCRAIRAVNADRSLSFFCAIDDGIVLTLARTDDVVAVTSRLLDSLQHELGALDAVVAFDCVHRRIEAEYRNRIEPLGELYAARGVVGFNTYGEQFGAMHLNHTITGIAFGRRVDNGRLDHDDGDGDDDGGH